jgi:hypothetical protein
MRGGRRELLPARLLIHEGAGQPQGIMGQSGEQIAFSTSADIVPDAREQPTRYFGAIEATGKPSAHHECRSFRVRGANGRFGQAPNRCAQLDGRSDAGKGGRSLKSS